jgi:F-type H+-transporting ATPase subunit c
MTKKLGWLAFLMMIASSIMFAQGAETAVEQAHAQWKAISSAFGMAIASGLCGLAQAKAIAACAEGMARNPGATAAIRFALLLGLILIESLALYTLVIIILQVK